MRGRVQIINNVVVADNGENLRGGPMPLSKGHLNDEVLWISNENNWIRAKYDGHLNAMRIVCFDAWARHRGCDYLTVDEQLPYIDSLVQYAENNGMYAIINFHDVGNKNNSIDPVNCWLTEFQVGYEMDFATEFWNKVADRYKNKTHVVFELLNEPIYNSNTNVNYYRNNGHYANFKQLYDIVRGKAPNSHIILFSFQNLVYNIEAVVAGFSSDYPSIDWTNESVGFHFYGISPNIESNLIALKNNYPVICTEWDYPGTYSYVPQLSNELYNGESLERLGISWLDWRAGRREVDFQGKFLDQFKVNAINEGYFWPLDTGNTILNLLPPSNINAISTSSSEIQLSWTDAPSGDNYTIFYGTNPNNLNDSTTVLFNQESKLFSGLQGSTVYYFKMKTNQAGESSSYSSLIDAQTGGSTTNDTTRYELEDYFEVVNDVGSKGVIQASIGGFSMLSGTKGVQFYDSGDKFKISFNISSAGEYLIKVRLRSGNSASSTAYWPGGYQFKIDNNLTSFNGDNSTISSQDNSFGISYWGTMEANNINLTIGNHELEIGAIENWCVADYVEIIKTDNSSPPNSVISILAAGKHGSENLALIINGNTVASYNNIGGNYSNGTFQNITFNHTSKILSGDEIRIQYLNDNGTQRDLRVDKIVVDGIDYQSENAYSTGSWTGSTCGNMNTEYLHCGGYFEYIVNSPGSRISSKLQANNIQFQENSTIKVYPNPSKDIINISFNSKIDIERFYIRSVDGRFIHEEPVSSNQRDFKLDLNSQSAGLYLGVFYLSNGTVEYKKFILKK
ncbi:cellulase family glycosylhydrolase [Flexithrix dorotheae]|uniref:cellulase family glycosylhydrolase n=1 Tax=Flexithrix dorotheae TaxID=70993 RepID=UPI0003A8D56F|nr:cellulase family glycosylhydrolase [Flexithrix dorotheae]